MGGVPRVARKISLEDRECPLSATLGLVGEWWTLLILHDAFDGYTRFDQVHDNLGISSSLLTSRLKRLVDVGLLERRQYQTKPVRHEYVLTETRPFPAAGDRRTRRVGQRAPGPEPAQHGAHRQRNRSRSRADSGRPPPRAARRRTRLHFHARSRCQSAVPGPLRRSPHPSVRPQGLLG